MHKHYFLYSDSAFPKIMYKKVHSLHPTATQGVPKFQKMINFLTLTGRKFHSWCDFNNFASINLCS